jgi:hypothetical protein
MIKEQEKEPETIESKPPELKPELKRGKKDKWVQFRYLGDM